MGTVDTVGFLDRFSKDTAAAPDAFTTEMVARIRALPSVERAEPTDADTVSVTWSGGRESEAVDISGLRQPWKQAKGFDRIELLDDFIAGLSPGQYPPASPTSGDEPDASPEPGPAPPPGPTATDAVTEWSQVASQLVPVLRRVRAGDGALTWPIGELLEATAIWAGGATPITDDQCAVWGVGLDDVRSAATSNLVAIDPAPDAIGPGARAWVPTSPEGLQSSWLAAPERLLHQLGLATAIVLVPLRSELVVVDPEDIELVQSILTNTLAILESQANVLCPVPFLVTAEDVQDWMPAASHPAAQLVHQTRDLLTR